jgi:enoyl-CoA hydratase/carnithine racemase
LANEEVASVVVTCEGKFFSNGLDLKFIEQHPQEAGVFQKNFELLLDRLLCFPVPTVAAINGHFCAAGAMFGLAFDYRIMNAEVCKV